MPAIKDKCVVVPISPSEIEDTVANLPRLPSESGIIDIEWKRRHSQKNSHLQAKVNPERIFKALEFLKACGNKHYQTATDREEYKKRCSQEDPDGYKILFGGIDKSSKLEVIFYSDGSAEPILELKSYLDMCEMQKLEEEYCQKDTVCKDLIWSLVGY